MLWSLLQEKYGVIIHFAHRTFKWNNEAKGNAAVYCVIVGFANFNTSKKIIFDLNNALIKEKGVDVQTLKGINSFNEADKWLQKYYAIKQIKNTENITEEKKRHNGYFDINSYNDADIVIKEDDLI